AGIPGKKHWVSKANNQLLNQSRTFFLMVLVLLLLSRLGNATTDPETILSQAGINLIPYPQEVLLKGEDFKIKDNLTLVLDKDATDSDKFAASILAETLLKEYGITSKLAGSPSGSSIILTRQGAD